MAFALHAALGGLLNAWGFFWDSLFGLIFGFLVSAVVQVALTPAAMHRYLGPKLRHIFYAAGFGIISSACSYGAAAAARGFYQKGADLRPVFAFMIASTNMNVAILILFWSLLGWKFAFAEFFGGVIIIAVVTAGLTLLFGPAELARLRQEHPSPLAATQGALVSDCPLCGMEGEAEYAVEYSGTTYWACGGKHHASMLADPALCANESDDEAGALGWSSLRLRKTWVAIAETAIGDVQMLRTELLIGYLIAGYAAALVPPALLSGVLQSVGAVPFAGPVLLLAVGLLVAVATFVCSMGNVPVARFLANAGIPLSANTAFIYGDLLIPPLIAIYRKSFPPRVTWTFVGLFTVGSMLAGAIMEWTIGDAMGGVTMGSMAFNDRFTIVSNAVGIIAVLVLAFAVRRPSALPPPEAASQRPA